MLKRLICFIVLAAMSLSLTGCSEVIGAVYFAYLSAMNNTYVEKEDVFEYVIENESLLYQAIETGDYSALVCNGTFEYDDISYTFDHESKMYTFRKTMFSSAVPAQAWGQPLLIPAFRMFPIMIS